MREVVGALRFQRLDDRPSQRADVAGREELRRMIAILELCHLSENGQVAADDWTPDRHRFDQGSAQTFERAREDESVSGAQQVGDVVSMAEEPNVFGQTELVGPALQIVGARAFPTRKQHDRHRVLLQQSSAALR